MADGFLIEGLHKGLEDNDGQLTLPTAGLK